MHVQSAAGARRERLGHETGDEPVLLRHAAQHPLEHHGFVDGAQRVLTMMQRDLELPRRVFGHQRLGGQALRHRGGVDVVEQRREIVQPLKAVGVYLLALAGASAARGREYAARSFLQ